MFKDYSFLNILLNDDGTEDKKTLFGMIGIWLENAQKYYETNDFVYVVHKFQETNAGILIKLKRHKNNDLHFYDYQPIVFASQSIKVKLLSIDKDADECVFMLNDNKAIVFAEMDALDFKREEEVYVNFNFFPLRVEFSENEEDYFNQLRGNIDDELNIFNIGIGLLIPPIALIKGDKASYPKIKDEMLNNFHDSFMISSGVIEKAYAIQPIFQADPCDEVPNGKIPLGRCDCFEFKTSFGLIPAIVEEEILRNTFNKQNIKEFAITKDSIIKVYGYLGAFIDVEKTLNNNT